MLLVIGVSWVAWIISFVSIFPFVSYIGPSSFIFSTIGSLAVFSTVAIPILGLMLLITRWFSSYRIPKHWRTNLRLAWGGSLLVALLSGFSTAMSFNHEADLSDKVEYSNSSGVLTITELATKHDKPIGIIKLPDLLFTKAGLINENVHFDVLKSKGEDIVIETKLHSYGKSFVHAQTLANAIEADHELKENVLKLPKSFKINRGSKFRGQHVDYLIHIPEGKTIKFDKSIANLIWDSGYFRDRIRPKNLENYEWTMTDNGLASVGWDKEYRAERLIDAKSVANLNIDARISTTISYGEKTEILLKGPKTEINKIEKVETDGATTLMVDGWLSNRITLDIKTPSLKSLQAKSVRSLKIEGFKQENMELNFSGDGYLTEVKIYVDVENLTCNVGGSNDISMLGSGKNLLINILSGSRVTAEQYKAENVIVKGNIYNNSSFYASDSFECPPHEKHSITLYGVAEINDVEKAEAEVIFEKATEKVEENTSNPQ